MPLIQWILNLSGTGSVIGSGGAVGGGAADVAAIYTVPALGTILAGGNAIVTVSTTSIPSMVNFLGALAEGEITFRYPTDYAY